MLKLFLIGFIGGVLSGILGIGGGIVFVPLLTYFTKEDFNLPKDKFILCCFNQHQKIIPRVFSVWMNILENLPLKLMALKLKEEV